MDYPSLAFIDPYSILVINPSGKMKQLFVPFKAQVIGNDTHLVKDSWLIVEEIAAHNKYRLLYKVGIHWWPYYLFRLSVVF
jgi:hypothetical protein